MNINLSHKPSLLERFGLFYLNVFKKKTLIKDVFSINDVQMGQQIRRSKQRADLLTFFVSIVSVLPIVWVDIAFEREPVWIHYGLVILVTLISMSIELYILFVIALKLVHDLKNHLGVNISDNDNIFNGALCINNILARTALELPDPEYHILGIDPFKRISKKNLLAISLLYKVKIMLSNVIIKYSLIFFIGKSIFGVSILYEAVIVECFWNYIIVRRITHETRLRLFGFVLANKIVTNVERDGILNSLSNQCKLECLRAIGNAVVMTQNYHPNMMVLLIKFKEMLPEVEGQKLDDWNLFIQGLSELSCEERYFVLDLFTVATAFDGKISKLEKRHLGEVFQHDYTIYKPRILKLTQYLKTGKLNKALYECQLDYKAG